MAFTVEDFQDLLKLLREHPEWLLELRRVLVAEDFERINASLQGISDEIAATRADFNARMEAFDERFGAVERSLAEIARQMKEFADALFLIDTRLGRMEVEVARNTGWRVESRLRERAPAYFGRALDRATVVVPANLPRVRTAEREGRMSDEEWTQLTALDILLRGLRPNGNGERHEVYVAIEASSVVDLSDVTRAHARAGILRKLGYQVSAAVGGESIHDDARHLADELSVRVVLSDALTL